MQHLVEKDYSARELLNALQKEANEAVNYIDELINDYDHVAPKNEFFTNVLEFDEDDFPDTPEDALKESTWGCYGVYVFVAKEDFTLTRDQVFNYNERCSGARINTYGEVHIKKGEHFYQGSATSNSLLTRLKAHYSNYSDSSAIQINNTYRSVIKGKIKVYIFPMVDGLKHKPFFIKMIESELHRRFPAISGGNRV